MSTEVVSGATTGVLAGRRLGAGLALGAVVVMMAGASAPSPFYPGLQVDLGLAPWVMTAVFAVYAVALLATLLVVGSISDHVGRRPVVTVGFVLLAAGFALFRGADSAAVLFEARILQGLASGLLLSTLSATVTDFERPSRPGSAAMVNAIAPTAGLAVGAVVAGVVLEALADARLVVFDALVVLSLVIAAAVWLVPETAPRHEGLLASLRPRVAVPPAIRGLLALSAPAIFAGWATGGLFLSLGAAIVRNELGATSHVLQGLVIGALSGAGAIAVYLFRGRTARATTLYGTAALAGGTVLSLLALASGSVAAYLIAVVVAGTGFGTAFFGILRTITPLLPAHERAEVFAVIFVISYLAFGIPAVVAGLLTPQIGLAATTYGYGAVVALLSATAGLLRWRSAH
ncbi:putative MFS family arabinose efflux permease [Nocardioides luteus]|uniref:MFS transporter n=1 Tax=Nocardioides luteus TaxID=1844 RepID=A0ABQ5SYC0_9ACTN|nr:MFS transporter [Nocardioides luteus]MDR7312410.1 putative MFS family arabinose efflux permease [Nocardioides luteus]GGR58317.1 MFS transporter [Nocardioides luteus]GLJ68658.1 MFS transporter [Nocardioides luteus]